MANTTTLKTRVQQKIDTSTNWAKATNFVPLKGEIIIYSDLGKFKIGDGTTTVVNLAFFYDDIINNLQDEDIDLWEAITNLTNSIAGKQNSLTADDYITDEKFREITGIPSLNEVTWEQISIMAASGLAASYWNIGDRKTITIDTIGTFDVYIIGFNHNGATNTIDFGGFKQTSDGKDLALYSYQMNNSDTTTNGWKGCRMRYDILGSTDVSNGDATSTCATSPVSGSLMAKFPADLRQVMKPMTIYTNNVGGGTNTTSNVTTSVDYLPLLAGFEIFGARTYANDAESDHQQQYAYYSSGNSKVKYRHNATSSTTDWWQRSPSSVDSAGFCVTWADGYYGYLNASYSYHSVAPIFRV